MIPESTLAPGALTLNPAAAIRLDRIDGHPAALQWRGLAARRGWRPVRLRAEGPKAAQFQAVLQLLDGAAADMLSLPVALDLWRCGILVSAAERAMVPDGRGPELEISEACSPPWLPPVEAGPRLWQRLFQDFVSLADNRAPFRPTVTAAEFATSRWAWLPGLISAREAAAAASIWRGLSDAGLMVPSSDRGFHINNDPLGRAFLRHFTPAVTELAGRPLRESYCFAMDYRPGAALPAHTDRAQCDYTISLFLEGTSPWALELETGPVGSVTRFEQAAGDGLLFRGQELRHGRPALGKSDRALVLMLHWVGADFPDADMDRS